jgi:hypothetical protein
MENESVEGLGAGAVCMMVMMNWRDMMKKGAWE